MTGWNQRLQRVLKTRAGGGRPAGEGPKGGGNRAKGAGGAGGEGEVDVLGVLGLDAEGLGEEAPELVPGDGAGDGVGVLVGGLEGVAHAHEQGGLKVGDPEAAGQLVLADELLDVGEPDGDGQRGEPGGGDLLPGGPGGGVGVPAGAEELGDLGVPVEGDDGA